MYIHEIVHDAALYMPLMLMHNHFLAGVVYLHVAVLRLHALVQRFVLLLIVFYPEQEVVQYVVCVLNVGVVWAAYFYFLEESTIRLW